MIPLQLVFQNGSVATLVPRLQPTTISKGEDVTYAMTCVNEDGTVRDITGHTFTLGIIDPTTGVRVVNRVGSISGAGSLGKAIAIVNDGDTVSATPSNYVLSIYVNDGAQDWQPLPLSPVYIVDSASMPGLPVTPPGPDMVLVGLAPVASATVGDVPYLVTKSPLALGWKTAGGGGAATSLNLAATVATELSSVTNGGSTNALFQTLTPSDASTTPWYRWMGSFANSGGRRNQVHRWGWNIAGGGGRQVTSGTFNGALADEYEQYFEGYLKVMERHMTFVSPVDVQTRFLSFDGALEAPYTTRLFLSSNQIKIGRGTNPSDNDGAISITATETFVGSPNGFNRIRANNTSGAYIESGTTNTPNAQINLQPIGDVYVEAGRFGFIGQAGIWQLRWTVGDIMTIQSPNGNHKYGPHDNAHYFGSNGTVVLKMSDTAAEFTTPINYIPVTAPASPASGWTAYTDIADGKFKIKASTGTVVTLGTP